MNCNHISKVLEWGFTKTHDFKVTLYGCVLCDITSTMPFKDEDIYIDHMNCGEECFGCKAKNLQLSVGDAGGKKAMPAKKWDKELNAYSAARKQGIQPAGTSLRQVQEAVDKSNKVGKAFDANTNGFKE
jgi:hypothetical protein